MIQKNFIVEIQMQDNLWERSWALPDVYTYAHGRELIDGIGRNSGVKVRLRRLKPVYLHVATQLELLGAKAMLVAAYDHIVRLTKVGEVSSGPANPFMILMDAKLAVIRQLEEL